MNNANSKCNGEDYFYHEAIILCDVYSIEPTQIPNINRQAASPINLCMVEMAQLY